MHGLRQGLQARSATRDHRDGGAEVVHAGSIVPYAGVSETHRVAWVGRQGGIGVGQVEVKVVGADGQVGRHGQLFADGRDGIVGQPPPRVGCEGQRAGDGAVAEHQIGGACVIERCIARVAHLHADGECLALCDPVGIGAADELVTVAHPSVEVVEDAARAPAVGHRRSVLLAAERPVVGAHLGLSLGIDLLGQRRALHIGLAAVGDIERLRGYVAAQHGVVVRSVAVASVGALVAVLIEESVVVVAEPCAVGAGEGLGDGQCVLVAEVLYLDEGVAREQEAVLRAGVKQSRQHGAAVGGQLLGLVAEVVAVVPLAPYAYEACLEHVYDVRIGGQVGLELGYVGQHARPSGVVLVILVLGVGKAQHALEPLVAQHLHVVVEALQHGGTQRAGAVGTEVIEEHDQCLRLACALVVEEVFVAPQQQVRAAVGDGSVELVGEASFGVAEDGGVVGRVGHGHGGQAKPEEQGGEQEKRAFHGGWVGCQDL